MQMQTPNRTTIFENDAAPRIGTSAPIVAWREPMTRGILAILIGITLIAFPVSASFVLAIAFGVFVLVDGILAVMAATKRPQPDARRWWWALLGRGVLGIVVGAIAIVFPGIAAVALGVLIAIWAIVIGALEIGVGLRTHHDAGRETLVIALGVLTVVLGIVFLFAPLLALVAQVYVFAFYAIVAGIGLVAFAMRLRKRAAFTRSRDTV